MKRVAAVALVVLGLMGSACAQRGGSRGGVSGASFHGLYASTTRFSYAPAVAPRVSPFRVGVSRGPGVEIRGRRPEGFGYGHPRGFNGPYRQIVVPWVMEPPYEYGDITTDVPGQDANVGVTPGPEGYGQESGDVGPQEAAPVYQAYNEPPRALAPVKEPEPEDAVTLVFKDGRPPEKIHNYILSRTMLYVRDGRKQDIAVSDLDLAATEKANREAGVEFALPAGTR